MDDSVKRGLHWPVAMALILVLTVLLNIRVAMLASADPSFAIEKDYYARALDWDNTAAVADASERLRWTLLPTLEPFTESGGALLRVALADSMGKPIVDADVDVAAFFNARASEVHDVKLLPDSAGGYSARLPVAYSGSWELRFRVRAGAVEFRSISRVTATRAPAGRSR